MKGTKLKLACLAGIIFLLVMLPSCSLFDMISGTWDGEMTIEIDWSPVGGTEAGDVDITVTLMKSGTAITGDISEASDLESLEVGILGVEWDLPGSVNGTADGKNVSLDFEIETSYLNSSLVTINVDGTGTLIGVIEGDRMTGTVEGVFDFSGGVDYTFDFDGDFQLLKIN